MPVDAAVICPILKPEIVTVNWPVVTVAPDVVQITFDVVGILHVPVKPAILLLEAAIAGCADVAKNPKQYVKVILPPGGIALVGAKLRVTGTFNFVAIRSDSEIVKFTNVTWL